jgi:hypothetical protein
MPVSDDDEEETPKPKAKAAEPKTKAAPVEEKEEDEQVYSEADLKEMDVKALMQICKERGIEVPAEGKNTNAKLRNLILAAQDGADDEEAEEEAPKSKKASAGKATSLRDKVLDVLEQLDSADITEAKAVKSIVELSEEADEKAVKKIIKSFLDDDKMDIEEVADNIVASFEGGEDDEEEEAPKSKKKDAKKKDADEEEGEEVDPAELQKGDKVSVFWKSYKEWFNGEVVSTRGGVKVKYDEDGAIEMLDAEETPKVKLLEAAE